MPVIPINLGVEDELTEVVVRRLLVGAGRGYQVGVCYGRTGYGYLQTRVRGWNAAARGVPFVVVTDLDQHPCPIELVTSWLGGDRHPNLLFRVAVREIEAWLLADGQNLSRYLAVSKDLMPHTVEDLPDPKRTLVELARRSRRREIRERIAPRVGSTAKQGPDYNACLAEFVQSRWDFSAAAAVAPSLGRSLRVFQQFVPVWEGH